MKPYIYLRVLRHADHTVFCVEDGQKTYWDPIFNVSVPFSSGQQVKRSRMENLLENLGEKMAPITFNYEIKNGKIGTKEPWSPCDPSYTDQLLGGWMKAQAEKSEKDEDKTDENNVVKRRSPISFSAMRPLHPLLARVHKENITFDRSDCPETESDSMPAVRVRQGGKELSAEEIEKFLNTNDRTLTRRTWIPEIKSASGLFVYDIAIDLRRLFCVSIGTYEPEISRSKIEKLKTEGWKETSNAFGKCLVLPKEKRDKIITALANAVIDWRITSNQSRTFSIMETLAVAISDNANTIAGAIRAKLADDSDTPKAKPIADSKAGADLFVTLPCAGYMITENESYNALEKAKQKLIEMMNSFDYENQEAQS